MLRLRGCQVAALVVLPVVGRQEGVRGRNYEGVGVARTLEFAVQARWVAVVGVEGVKL